MTEQPGRYRISPSTDKAFRSFVRARYGDDFKKGHYSVEADRAFLKYISVERLSNTHAHAQEMKSLFPKRILNGREKMLNYLVGNHRYEPGKGIVNVHHLTDSIKFAFGSDGRTVNTKIPELKKYDIIREYGETFQFTPLMEDSANEQELKQPDERAKKELDDALTGYETI